MSDRIRFIAPFLPLPLEGGVHQYIAPSFDWMAAIRMLFDSVTRSNPSCPIHVVTDVSVDLPFPCLKYRTEQRRLMLWTVEACLAYLKSPDFDRDTVMLDCDQLVFKPLAPLFPDADLGVLIRVGEKYTGTARSNPFLNGVQFWAVAGREALIAFYRKALQVARALPEYELVWGGDTVAVLSLLEPLQIGTHVRAGCRVAMLHSEAVLESYSRRLDRQLRESAQSWQPSRAVLDFRGRRKLSMEACYAATLGGR